MRKKGLKAGFTLTEVILAMLVVLFMGMMMAAIIPVTAVLNQTSGNYNHAITLASRKLAQIQEAGYFNMTGPLLGQNGLDIVDGTPSTPSSNDLGDQTASFEFTATDSLWEYFPNGTLSNGTRNTGSMAPRGYIYIAPYTPSAMVVTGSTRYNLIQVTVTIQWWNLRGRALSYSATTLIPRTDIE